jgi:hypothetical protein
MKKATVVGVSTLALVAAFGSSASAGAGPPASCQGLAVSSLAGEAGAVAQERRDAFAQAEEFGVTPGAVTSQFARHQSPSLDACFE